MSSQGISRGTATVGLSPKHSGQFVCQFEQVFRHHSWIASFPILDYPDFNQISTYLASARLMSIVSTSSVTFHDNRNHCLTHVIFTFPITFFSVSSILSHDLDQIRFGRAFSGAPLFRTLHNRPNVSQKTFANWETSVCRCLGRQCRQNSTEDSLWTSHIFIDRVNQSKRLLIRYGAPLFRVAHLLAR
jgi:hypothetical protein